MKTIEEAKKNIKEGKKELTHEELDHVVGGTKLAPAARTPEAQEAKRKKEQDVREMIAEWKKAIPARRDEITRTLLSPEYVRILREIDPSFYFNELAPFI